MILFCLNQDIQDDNNVLDFLKMNENKNNDVDSGKIYYICADRFLLITLV